MNETDSITISRQEERPFDYATLRQEAIELVQKLSGKIWTDYNTHDPGVTILEQIVFTLTELGYKTCFGIEDYLSSLDNGIDYESQALYSPSQVMSSFSVTREDYSSFFRENICYKRINDNSICNPEKVSFNVDENGFYKVDILVRFQQNELIKNSVIESFYKLWRKWRCMGDHVSHVRVVWIEGLQNIATLVDSRNGDVLPVGVHRDLTDFSPMINLFPTIYREGESAEHLKKYLAPIEHVFKKYLSLLDFFPNIFSLNLDVAGKSLENEISVNEDFKIDLTQYSFALDQMLAMYGVRFPKFDFVDFTRQVHCKVQYLRELPDLLLHRAGLSWNRRVELMLGVLHDAQDVLKIYSVDGIFENENAGFVRIVIFTRLKNLDIADDVESFVCKEIPAHLIPIFYWMPQIDEREFESLYADWIEKSAMNPMLSPKMVQWFIRHKQFASEPVWL